MAEVLRKTVPALGIALLLGGCGGSAADQRSALPVERAAPAAAPPQKACRPGREQKLGDGRRAYAARAKGSVTAFARPGGQRVREFGPRNVNGVRTVLGVLGIVRDRRCEPAWYRVQLPIRPNGASGYVNAADVRLLVVRTRIEVDLSERRIDFFQGGRRVESATAGIGSEATPTPTGRYYVNQRLLASDPEGPFGPGAIGISAFSPVLTNWAQGGPIAIHGTNDPSSIGRAVTNGCLRIPNELLVRMFGSNPEGTPVLVRA
ncbi:MAG TPA: L,D-transpeptidase [Gaiellaceae bacterium]|nr:L,D-transpeptidase [Gaiellaceae bacterium]